MKKTNKKHFLQNEVSTFQQTFQALGVFYFLWETRKHNAWWCLHPNCLPLFVLRSQSTTVGREKVISRLKTENIFGKQSNICARRSRALSHLFVCCCQTPVRKCVLVASQIRAPASLWAMQKKKKKTLMWQGGKITGCKFTLPLKVAKTQYCSETGSFY